MRSTKRTDANVRQEDKTGSNGDSKRQKLAEEHDDVCTEVRWACPELELSCCIGNTVAEAVRRLDDIGCTVLENLMAGQECDAIVKLIDASRARASEDEFTDIYNKRKRRDIPLAVPPYADAIATILKARDGLLRKTLFATVGSSAGLVEFGGMSILPGAATQPVHQDVHMQGPDEAQNARYVTVFLSLCDVPKPQGPMEVWAVCTRACK